MCEHHPRRPQCRLPTEAEYERAFRAFRERFPHVRTVRAVERAEPPHAADVEHTGDRRRGSRTSRRACCEGCTIVVGDLLDQADDRLARRPTYRATTRWIERYRAALRTPRDVCGIHNYSDVNRFRTAGTRALMRALGCRRYWLTETGGIMSAGGWPRDGAPPDARDRVPVPARRPRAADRARVCVHVVRARDAAVGLRARRAARGRDDDAAGPRSTIVREHVQAGARRPATIGRRSRRWRARRCAPGPRPRRPRALPEPGGRGGARRARRLLAADADVRAAARRLDAPPPAGRWPVSVRPDAREPVRHDRRRVRRARVRRAAGRLHGGVRAASTPGPTATSSWSRRWPRSR